jgi:hypothetical protein
MRFCEPIWRCLAVIVSILVFVTAFLFQLKSSWAGEFQESWGSARAMGMGGAFTAVASEGDALLYNPAALSRVTGVYWTIMNPRLGVNGPQALEIARTASSGSTLADTLDTLYGKAIWVGAGAMTSFVVPNFGVAAYANGNVGLNLQNPAYPEMNINYIFDYGIAVGGAIDFVPKIWSIGATVRRVNRTGTNLPLGAAVLSDLDIDSIKAELMNRGTGYGLDLGTMLTVPSPLHPTLALTIRNFGYTAFTHDEGMRSPPRADPDITVGGSLTFDTPIFNITTAMDYRYADRSDIQVGKKINLGMEFDLPLLQFRAGLHQGYYALGTSLSMGVLSFDLATYGVELGEYPGQLEDRRYMLQMNLGIGLDLGWFGGSGGDGANGPSGTSGRRRLKQRR